MQETYNFSPGPAMLPRKVMQQAKEQLIDFNSGISAMEISHRHKIFKDLLNEVNQNLIKLLDIPSNYQIIWATGGATGQFALAPLNLLGRDLLDKPSDLVADYFCTGHWSKKAIDAAEKYIKINKVVDSKANNYTFIDEQAKWKFSENPKYIYYTPNETIAGLRFNGFNGGLDLMDNLPEQLKNVPIIADMTSCMLSEPIDISKYGILFSAAQKNIGPSGITLVIIREDLLIDNNLPDVFNYKVLANSHSLINTPPTYNISIVNLVLKWLLDDIGGLECIKQLNQKKAEKLYDYIDSSSFYENKIVPEFRSIMNVTFDFKNKLDNYDNLTAEFIKQAESNNLFSLEGHRSVGGFRASIYNAMPIEGIDKLIKFMQEFAAK